MNKKDDNTMNKCSRGSNMMPHMVQVTTINYS